MLAQQVLKAIDIDAGDEIRMNRACKGDECAPLCWYGSTSARCLTSDRMSSGEEALDWQALLYKHLLLVVRRFHFIKHEASPALLEEAGYSDGIGRALKMAPA